MIKESNTQYAVNKSVIAKNAVYLYIRTFIIMLVTLYTSRVVLQVLGETDYGIYNVVGGITILFSFITNAMTSATQRFMNVELGKGDINGFHSVFCASMNLYIIMAFLLIAVGETIGLWFLNSKLNIPTERMHAALWVYHFSILASCLTLLRIPYNACIIAYEKMSLYAYISIVEAVLKLGTVFILMTVLYDNLIFYSLLMTIVAFGIFLCYYFYCKKFSKECIYKIHWDKNTTKQLLSFSGWSLFGSGAVVCANQGIVFIMNIFCGVIVNAALGIITQVQTAINSFVSGFQTAFNPQIVKSYTSEDKIQFYEIILTSSRISYFLLLIPTIPLYFWCGHILKLWLGLLPEYTVAFTQITLVILLIECLANPLFTAIQATGRISVYQFVISIQILLNLPIAYLILKYGGNPIYILLVKMAIHFVIYISRLIFVHKLTGFHYKQYSKDVLVKVSIVTFLSLLYPSFFYNASNVLINILITCIVEILVILLIGIKQSERQAISVFLKSKLK